ncbi:MAG: GntR family transcriptional regulator [Ruminococcaceae bacterium]|nr:GntR family transcriptional regulator [Oscillospiraceae bacterium]
MISFDSFIIDGILPIYLQIILFIKRGIIAGTVKNGEELPSRRVLSALLGVNPNTVQKAFAILEEEGLILSRAGAKSVINVSDEKLLEIKEELLINDIKNIVSALKQTGLSMEQATELIKANWEEEN